jgi:hypothetical protein
MLPSAYDATFTSKCRGFSTLGTKNHSSGSILPTEREQKITPGRKVLFSPSYGFI